MMPRQLMPFMPPAPPEYGLGEYLRNDWGIDVKADYRVIPAIVDETQPGTYRLDPIRFSYFPLATFTDQPVGEPLRGQRVMWNGLCPIDRVRDAGGRPGSPPEGLTEDGIEPILTVPREMRAVWATRDIRRLVLQLQSGGGEITPKAGEDLMPPFDVAVAAVRKKTDKTSPARIVVLGMGMSLVDAYMDEQVPQLDERGAMLLADPPRADADIVINSVFWLVGLKGQIARGPARIEPVEAIAPTTMRVLWVLCVGLLPAAIIGLGGVVVLLRKR
jgi:hypothetical protein